jgi:hypothetical protein
MMVTMIFMTLTSIALPLTEYCTNEQKTAPLTGQKSITKQQFRSKLLI